jgi:hypothetical protein
MNVVLVSKTFVESLSALGTIPRRQTIKALQTLLVDATRPALRVKRLEQFGERRVFSARVNRRFRLLMEQHSGGVFRVWRVCHHDDADTRRWLPEHNTQEWYPWTQ